MRGRTLSEGTGVGRKTMESEWLIRGRFAERTSPEEVTDCALRMQACCPSNCGLKEPHSLAYLVRVSCDLRAFRHRP